MVGSNDLVSQENASTPIIPKIKCTASETLSK